MRITEMKIKQFNHLWNGQHSKNPSKSFPRPPRITGERVRQSNGRPITPIAPLMYMQNKHTVRILSAIMHYRLPHCPLCMGQGAHHF